MTRQWLSLSLNGSFSVAKSRISRWVYFMGFCGVMGWPLDAAASSLEAPKTLPAQSLGTVAKPRLLGDFSAAAWQEWQNVTNFPWEPKNVYLREDSPEGPRVQVNSHGAASMLLRHVNLNVQHEPVVSWRWRIAGPIPGADETLRDRDDCAARVYFLWNLRSRADIFKTTGIGYVWGQGRRVGEMGPSPYTGQIGVFTLRSGRKGAGAWQSEQRDLVADYRAFFKKEPPGPVTAIAVLTDTDQVRQPATAWYGQIFVRARP